MAAGQGIAHAHAHGHATVFTCHDGLANLGCIQHAWHQQRRRQQRFSPPTIAAFSHEEPRWACKPSCGTTSRMK